jgi:replicative DNA helicase
VDPGLVVQCLDAARPLNVPATRLLIVEALPADSRQPATLLALRQLARSRRLSVVVVVEEDVQRSDPQLRRIEQVADVVLRIHRDDQTEPESPRAGEADFRVSRHRLGPQATIVVAFQGHYGRFVDLAR